MTFGQGFKETDREKDTKKFAPPTPPPPQWNIHLSTDRAISIFEFPACQTKIIRVMDSKMLIFDPAEDGVTATARFVHASVRFCGSSKTHSEIKINK